MNHFQASPRARKAVLLFTVIGLITLGVLCFWGLKRSNNKPAVRSQSEPNVVRADTKKTAGNSNSQSGPKLAITVIQRELLAKGDARIARSQFDELRRVLQNSAREDVVAAIREFLDSKADIPSQLSFKIGANGFLTEAPSLRVFLIDYLDQVDRAAAAKYAKEILASMNSPDEWAVALRTTTAASTAPEDRQFVAEKLKAMLTHEPWMQDPSAGFLEAFDVAVHLGGTSLVPTLAELVRMKDNQAVAHAAYLAIDRLTIADPGATLSFLQADPDLMKGREATRANFFARADVRDNTQRKVVEEYLLDSRLSGAELDKFAGLYPNANFMVSHNLLTQSSTPDRTWLAGRDAESLRLTREWLGDPRFVRLRPQLEMIRQRLELFVQQAARAP